MISEKIRIRTGKTGPESNHGGGINMAAQLLSTEGAILLWIQENLRMNLSTPVMKLLSLLGDAGIFWIVLTLCLLVFKKTRRAGICSAFALILSLLICNILLKNTVARIRPYEMVEGLTILVKKPTDYSFPSGHSSAAFASATALLASLPGKNRRRWGILLLILAALIAFSRLYVGVHYPTDVLCGILIGILCGYCGRLIGFRIADHIPGARIPT